MLRDPWLDNALVSVLRDASGQGLFVSFKSCVLSWFYVRCQYVIVVQITGAEVTSVSAVARHLDSGLPPPDNVSALL